MCCMLPPRSCSRMPAHWPQQPAWCHRWEQGNFSATIGSAMFVLLRNGLTKYEMTGKFDWKQVAHIDLASEPSAEEEETEEYFSMDLYGDRLLVRSWGGRRNVVVLDQCLNEIVATSTGDAIKFPVPLGDRLLTSHDFVTLADHEELCWIDVPECRLVPTGVPFPNTMGDLVYVSHDEVAYFNQYDDTEDQRIDVHCLDRNLYQTSYFVPMLPDHEVLLVVVDGRLMVLTYNDDDDDDDDANEEDEEDDDDDDDDDDDCSDSFGTLDLLVLDCQHRTQVRLPFRPASVLPAAHEGRLFVPMMSDDHRAPQLAVYCFNRDAVLLWHACFPFPADFWLRSIQLLPDGRLALLMHGPPDGVSAYFLD
eukprot:TRINITY_DN5044_c0_g2_i2.p1 TRINITY_DN5044_c0_g2~~TRINITY_DN5044_c0_g2_i2.p1  ORF type:complete len:364 (+),score=48.70 TRINITY_DN5044_c0_g2_i2:357-1448(+)